MSPVQFGSQSFYQPPIPGTGFIGQPGAAPGASAAGSTPFQNLHPPMFNGGDRVTFSGKTDKTEEATEVTETDAVHDDHDHPHDEHKPAENKGDGGVKKYIKPAVKLGLAAGLGAVALAGSALAAPTIVLPPLIIAAVGIPAVVLALSGLKDLLSVLKSGKADQPAESSEAPAEEAPAEAEASAEPEATAEAEATGEPEAAAESAAAPADEGTGESAGKTVQIRELPGLLTAHGVDNAKAGEVIAAITASEELQAQYPDVKPRAYTASVTVDGDGLKAIADAVLAKRATA